MKREKISDRINGFAVDLASTLKSLVKLVLSSRNPSVGVKHNGESDLIILANGPSLRTALDNDLEYLSKSTTMAVNFAANAPEFSVLKPEYYVLADPHFFVNQQDPNVSKLLSNLSNIDWKMTLFVPVKADVPALLKNNRNLEIGRFNFLASEGFRWFENVVFDKKLAMPRPRNVLIPSIMIGIWLGFKKIFLLGADHSWLNSISVDDDNAVVSIQPHFYKEDEREISRIRKDYLHYPLHTILESFRIAFKSYHDIRRYADERGVEIVNATPGSYIDAFKRGSYKQIDKPTSGLI